jgi:hypothetical protein
MNALANAPVVVVIDDVAYPLSGGTTCLDFALNEVRDALLADDLDLAAGAEQLALAVGATRAQIDAAIAAVLA